MRKGCCNFAMLKSALDVPGQIVVHDGMPYVIVHV